MKVDWWDDYERLSKRDMSTRRYVYHCANGVHFSPRMDDDPLFVLVIIGALDVVCLQTTADNI